MESYNVSFNQKMINPEHGSQTRIGNRSSGSWKLPENLELPCIFSEFNLLDSTTSSNVSNTLEFLCNSGHIDDWRFYRNKSKFRLCEACSDFKIFQQLGCRIYTVDSASLWKKKCIQQVKIGKLEQFAEDYWEQPSSANESAIENATKCLIESAIESGRKYSPKVSTQDRRYRWPYLIVIPFHNTFTMKRSAWRIRLNRIVAAVLREQGKTLWLKWKQEHAEGENFWMFSAFDFQYQTSISTIYRAQCPVVLANVLCSRNAAVYRESSESQAGQWDIVSRCS